MNISPVEIKKVLQLLADTPTRVVSLSQHAASDDFYFRPNSDVWSANDVLAHLRACADIWGKSIAAMIAREKPQLRYVSPRGWIRKTNYLELEFHGSLKTFAAQRHELLQVLKGLGVEDWSRSATFTGTTKGRNQNIFDYACRIAEHENRHSEQIENVLKLAAAQKIKA